LSAFSYLLYFTVNKLNVYFSSDEYKIRNTVDNWKEAWEDKNLDKYKSYLTEDYTYYGSDGKKTDLKEKLNRIEYTFKNYEYIKIRITDFEFVSDSVFTENDRKVQFSEKYESDKFNEEGFKILRLYKGEETKGEWKIYREIFKEK
jgi:ketosteroid isomerase-like protein